MTVRNFLSYVDKDPSSYLTLSATQVAFTGISANENASDTYARDTDPRTNLGLNLNWSRLLTCKLTSATNAAFNMYMWQLIRTASGEFVALIVDGNGDYKLREYYDSGAGFTTSDSSAYNGTINTVYYPTLTMDKTSNHGVLTCAIYSDSGRTTLLTTLTLNLHSYVQYTEERIAKTSHSDGTNSGHTGTGYVENFDVPTPSVSSPSYTFPDYLSTAEDFTTYAETDTAAAITVTASRVTVGSGLEYGRVSLYKAATFFSGARIKGTTRATGNGGSNSQTVILGLTNTDGNVSSWTTGVYAAWIYDGTDYKLKLYDIESGLEDFSSALTVNTDYHFEFRRHGMYVKLFIFSDATLTTWVDTVILHQIRDEDNWSTIYTAVTDSSAANDPGSWDLLDQAWDNTTGWTLSTNGGTIEINPAGELHCHPNASCYTQPNRNIGAIPSTYTVQFRESYTSLGPSTDTTSRAYTQIFNGEKSMFVWIFTDRVGVSHADSALPASFRPLITATGTFYIWRIVVDTTNNWVKIYRKTDSTGWTFVGKWTELNVNTGNDGLVRAAGAYRGTTYDVEIQQDYYKIASGLYPPALTTPVQGYIENVTIEEIVFDRFTFLGRPLTGTSEHDGESYPGTGWTESKPTGTTIEQSATWADTGTYSIHIIGKSDGTDDAALTDTFTAASKISWEAVAVTRVTSVTDGHVCRLFGFEQTSNGKKVGMGVYRSGSVYTWCILSYDGTTWTKTDSTHRVTLNSRNVVQMQWVKEVFGDSIGVISISVDGSVVAELNVNSWGNFYVDKSYIGYFGGAASFGANTERYIDNFYARMDRYMKFGSIARMSDGAIVCSGSDSEKHVFDYTATVAVFKSTDSTIAAFTHEKTIDTASKQDFVVSPGLIVNGSNLYCVSHRFDYTTAGENQRYSDVWKGTSPSGLVKVCDGGTGASGINVNASRLIESGKLLSVYCFIPPYTDISLFGNSFLKMAWYDLATDTWDALGNQIAHGDDYALCFPSETALFRRPSDNKLSLLTRWDEYVSGVQDAHFEDYRTSSDNGSTWSTPVNLRQAWGDKAGAMDIAFVGDYAWISGYGISSTDGVSKRQTLLIQVDPDSMEIINEKRWSYCNYSQDTGNGGLIVTEEADGFYIHVCIHSGLSLNYYRFLVGNPTGGMAGALCLLGIGI